MNKQSIQVVIADDNRFFCEALRDSINRHQEIDVKAIFQSLEELVVFTANNALDILILDINFNGQNSLDWIHKIKSKHQSFHIISLTTLNNEYLKKSAFDKGISCFVGKDSDLLQFKDIIIDCHENKLEKNDKGVLKKISVNNLVFTKRKLSILQSLFDHAEKNENDIAAILDITLSSLKSHKRELFEITNTKNTVELIKFGIQKGLIVS